MITCQYCGAKTPTGASFCDGCGAALTTAAASQAQSAAQAQLVAAHAARAQATAQQPSVSAKTHFDTGRLPLKTLLHKRYLILKAIGRGGMAAVYQASDTKSNRIVAIKEMSQDSLSPEEIREAQESFKREASLLQTLQHPNLPHVYEHFTEQGRNYLVMDYIDGETLEEKLLAAKRPLREAEVMYWAGQLCDALNYLHTRQPPIIFRDLKPANVMVTKRGEVKLIDFGIARFFSNRATHDTQALGTPGYAPPEQYGSTQTDPRADIYALGATLYHLLTNYDVGATPFALPPLRTRNPAITPRVADAIEHATRLDRKDRYAYVTDFARDLGVVSRGKATAGPQNGRMGQAQGQPRPNAGQRATYGAQPNGARARAAQGNPVQSAISAQLGKVAQAGAAGVAAVGAHVIKSRLNPQAPPLTASELAQTFIAAARTATGPAFTPTVQPRQIDMGALRAGQDGSATLTISGQNGSIVNGSLKPLAPWIQVDKLQFSGASSLIQVTARTSQIHSSGPQQGAIEVAVGNQRMYIPVRLDVQPAPVAQRPQPRPQPQAAPKPIPQAPKPRNFSPPFAAGVPFGASVRKGAQVAAQQAAASQATRASTAYAPSRNRSIDGLRLPMSLAAALVLAFGLPILLVAFAAPHLHAWIPDAMLLARALLAVGVIGSIAAAPIAYIGATPAPGRLRTTAFLSLAGVVVAMALTAPWQLTPAFIHTLPGAEQLGAVALTTPLLAGIGAALGAQPLISAGILTVARYIAARYRLVLLTAAVAGGWFGFAVAQSALSAVFQQAPLAVSVVGGCGLVIGVALGLLLATPMGYLVRRFAFG